MTTTVLGQLRPANTTAASIYTLPVKQLTELSHIIVCNTTGTAESFRIFLDADGTTYDQTTALCYDVPIEVNQMVTIPIIASLVTAGGSLGVRTSTNNALTFTLMGEVTDIGLK